MSRNLFWVLLRKEWLFQWRTKRLLTLVLVGVVLGLLATITELGTGVLLELVKRTTPSQVDLGPLLALLDRDPTLLGAAQNYFKNFFLLTLVIVLLGMGSVAGEARSGELAVVLVRSVSRLSVVAAKTISLITSACVGVLASALVFGLVAWPTLGAPLPGPFVMMVLLLMLFLSVYSAVTVMASALVRSSALAAGITALFILISNLSGFLPVVGGLLPEGCYKLALAVAFGKETAIAPIWTITSNLVLLVLLILLGGFALKRREI